MKNLLMAVLLIAVGACAGPQSRVALTPLQRQALPLSACAGSEVRRDPSCNRPVPQAPVQPTAASAPLLPALPALPAQSVGMR